MDLPHFQNKRLICIFVCMLKTKMEYSFRELPLDRETLLILNTNSLLIVLRVHVWLPFRLLI